MEFLGDLERAFATSLYPLRVPIAIGLAIAVVAVIVRARRRGWYAAARRHPARTTTAVVLFLAVALPVGWYLGSPLFIRTALSEPPPSANATPTAAPTVPATDQPMNSEAPAPLASERPADPTPTPAPALAAERRGAFRGADDFHFGEGTARLIETAPGAFTVRFEDFSVRNGPDLYVYLSPKGDGYAKSAIELGRLKATDGAFNTDVPAGANVSTARSVVVWCKQFGVLFAVAPLD